MRRIVARRRPIRILFALAAPTLVAIPIALLSMQWHRPTRVEMTLTVERLALTVAPGTDGERLATLLDYGRMRALRIDRLARLTFAPASLEIADEARFDLQANGFPEDAWQPLAVAGEVALAPGPGSPEVAAGATLQASDPDRPGVIKTVRVAAGTEAVMELGRETDGKRPWLTLDLSAPRTTVDLAFPAPFLVFADYLGLAGTEVPIAPRDSLSLRAGGGANTPVYVEGSGRGLTLQLEPVGSTDLLTESPIPVQALDFTRQGPAGERRSSLVGGGTLRYPDLPEVPEVKLAAGDYVSLGGLEKGRIESLDVAAEGERTGLRLTLDTIASEVRVGISGQTRDARLTWFDWLRYQPVLGSLSAIVLWLLPTTLAGYKLWQELRSPSAAS